ncbi:MAG TPA: secondary thiamine-phosphate synthase enzyme YjbQ [Deltaproteobacteria bacterium]|nr:secondary thiamine-phosphate synthase enzyme YjbQ [Deltaproteobacteria bacterium]
MRFSITFRTKEAEQFLDITDRVRSIVSEHGTSHQLCCLYALGATAAIMIQENWDPNIPTDVLSCLRTIVPKGTWLHDRVDGNGDAHIKAGIIGPSEVIPVENGTLLLSTWQNIFFCEFDGPRAKREVLLTLI